jgi:glycosyltransferase involved in cell wall biosynthesis
MMADYANKYVKEHNIPVVCTVHTKYAYCYKYASKFDFIVKILLKRVIKRAQNADKVTSVSYSMIPELKSYGLNKDVTVIKNGIDRHCNHCAVNAKKAEKFTIIYVGAIIDYKNIGFSLKALAQLKKKTSDFVFYMIGRGPHERKFKRMIKKLGLTDNVVLTGAITDRQKLFEMVTSADMCLFTSIFDNDSLVLLECADAGIPVMVLKDTGSAERIEDGKSGFIVENDEQKVAEKIFELMSKREYLQEVGANGCGNLTNWETMVNEYLEVYRSMLLEKNEEVATK